MPSGATRILLITPATLKANSIIETNVQEHDLGVCIRIASDKYLMPIIGSPLYEAVLNKIATNSLTGAYLDLTNNYIVPCLVEYSAFEAIPYGAFKFKNRGIEQSQNPLAKPAEVKDLNYLAQDKLATAQFYGQRLVDHLRANINLYPEYLTFTSMQDVRPSTNERFTGIDFPSLNSDTRGRFGKGYTYDLN